MECRRQACQIRRSGDAVDWEEDKKKKKSDEERAREYEKPRRRKKSEEATGIGREGDYNEVEVRCPS